MPVHGAAALHAGAAGVHQLFQQCRQGPLREPEPDAHVRDNDDYKLRNSQIREHPECMMTSCAIFVVVVESSFAPGDVAPILDLVSMHCPQANAIPLQAAKLPNSRTPRVHDDEL
eukprot:COSAG06_NODE_26147_length_620_cov_2.182342_1_plen_114_part_01